MKIAKKFYVITIIFVCLTILGVMTGICGCTPKPEGDGENANEEEAVVSEEETAAEDNPVEVAIGKANVRIAEFKQDEGAFADTVMHFLPQSAVYDTADGFLIFHDGMTYLYSQSLREVEGDYTFCSTLEEALSAETEVGKEIYTLGYYEKYDKGGAAYKVGMSREGDLSVETENGLYLNYQSATDKISLKQMGWHGDYINEYQNKFEKYARLSTLIFPQGEYAACDTMRTDRDDVKYFGIDATVYSIDNFGGKGNTVYTALWSITTDWKHDRTIKNQTYSGIKFEMRTKNYNSEIAGLKGLERVFMLSYCDNINIYNCSFIIPNGLHEDPKARACGCVDCFTDWHNVTFVGCDIENHSYVNAGGAIGFRDIYNKGCDNLVFTDNTVVSSVRDECVPIFAGVDKLLKPDAPLGNGYIRNCLLENNKFTALEGREGLSPRTMFLTVGYQLSPVYDIKYLNNTFDGYCNSYFLHYCYCNGLTFKGNTVNIRRTGEASKMTLIRRGDSPSASDIVVEDNVFNLLGDNFKLYGITLLSDYGDDMSELTVRNNVFNMSGGFAETLIGSDATVYNNIFNVKNVGSVYYRTTGNVYNNEYNIGTLSKSIYEFYNADVKHDLSVKGEKINIEILKSNFLMFNGSIKFNGHSLTFEDIVLSIAEVDRAYLYLAYSSDAVTDTVVPITFKNCVFDKFEGHLIIPKGDKHNLSII